MASDPAWARRQGHRTLVRWSKQGGESSDVKPLEPHVFATDSISLVREKTDGTEGGSE
jgi:hypothetical protein